MYQMAAQRPQVVTLVAAALGACIVMAQLALAPTAPARGHLGGWYLSALPAAIAASAPTVAGSDALPTHF